MTQFAEGQFAEVKFAEVITPQMAGARILIVDDNPANVDLLQAILEEAGYYKLKGITDPREVIPEFASQCYDLILLDIRMPHLNGIQVLELLKEYAQDDFVPVIVLTAQTDDDTRQQALQAGAQDFLTKPLRDWEVLLRIRNTLASRFYFVSQRDQAHKLAEQVKQQTFQLKETQLEILRRLSQAAEFRDNESGAHIVRMSSYALILAIHMGMDIREAETLLTAAPMHDIGKIGIPDQILLKPGKLTAEEFDVIKSHPAIGYKLLDGHNSELMLMAQQIAYSHHEKWDGSGYPQGLKGEEIPLVARICAVADVFDALTASRPYKKAWNVEDAAAFIRDNAGTHFDPAVVAVFMNSLEQILETRNQYPD